MMSRTWAERVRTIAASLRGLERDRREHRVGLIIPSLGTWASELEDCADEWEKRQEQER